MTNARRRNLTKYDAIRIEWTARRLARAFGYGAAWRMPHTAEREASEPDEPARGDWSGGLLNDTTEERTERMRLSGAAELVAAANVGTGDAGEPDLPGDVLQVVKRSLHVKEGAARSVTGADGKRTTRVTARHYWNAQRGRVLRPVSRMDADALIALGVLGGVEQAMLRTYAGELHQWPVVARWCTARGHRLDVACAAGDRILWDEERNKYGPDRTLAQCAKQAHMRKSEFCRLERLAHADLECLLITASRKFMTAIYGNPFCPADDFIGMDNENSAEFSPIARRAA